MNDLKIRCDRCNHVPAECRINGQILCRDCAHAAIDAACAPRLTIPTIKRDGESAIVDALRVDGPMMKTELRRRSGVRFDVFEAAYARMLADGRLEARVERSHDAIGKRRDREVTVLAGSNATMTENKSSNVFVAEGGASALAS